MLLSFESGYLGLKETILGFPSQEIPDVLRPVSTWQ